jgi:endonuclease/exonuclease/phosphatase family metal-dependent hydrolase/MFS family permease
MSQASLSPLNRQRRFILLASLLFLFFFQLLSDFIAAIYAFGLMGTGIPAEIVSVLFLFSPLLLFLFPERVPTGWLAGFAWLGMVCRAIEVALDTRGQMLVSGLGVAAFLLLFSGLYSRIAADPRRFGRDLSAGLLLAALLSVLFRTLLAGVDLTTFGMFRLVGWALVLIAAYLLWGWNQPDHPEPAEGQKVKSGRLIGLAIGITSAWLLLYFAFNNPHVIARWTGLPHISVLGTMLLSWLVYLWWWLRFGPPSRRALFVWGLIFTLALVLTIVPHQVAFPDSPQGYPLFEPEVGWWAYLPAYLMLVTSPVILAAFACLTREMVTSQPKARQLGAAFSIAALYMLVMIFGQVFTTVYDYIPVVGPFFRDKFWLVFLVLGLGLTFPLLLLKEVKTTERTPDSLLQWSAAAIVVAAFIGLLVLMPHPQPPTANVETLRVLTYNVQQGYDAAGQLNLTGQLAYIHSVAPDVIGIQETDTNRIANGNIDLVDFFARELNMFSYYGPKVVPGTFGIALLSRYPIEDARTFFLYSEGEQVAVIEAKITVRDETFTIYVNHLGNGGPMVQTEQFLQIAGEGENVIAMGDYNFRPYEDQHGKAVSVFDTAVVVAAQTVVPPEFDFEERIDHIFVSPGMQINLAQYLTEPESDHPALLVEVGW